MKRLFVVLPFGALLLGTAVALEPVQQVSQPEKNRTRFDGTWKIESAEFAGVQLKTPENHAFPLSDKLSISEGRMKVPLTFWLTIDAEVLPDPKNMPGAFNLLTPKGTLRGIYATDGTVLLLALQLDAASERPKQFNSAAGKEGILVLICRKQ